jgi:outer membrane lipoprotein-sorting protein
MNHRSASRLFVTRVAAALLVCGFCLWPASAQDTPASRAAGSPAFEPRALELLQRMTEAYADLPALDQETEFRSALIPLGGSPSAPSLSADTPTRTTDNSAPAEDRKAPSGTQEQKLTQRFRLVYARPNRLRMEWREVDEKQEKPRVTRWVSDGKFFYTYTSDKNWYTREKAPARLRDFAKLANMSGGSLELLMMMGVHPFANLREQVDGVYCDPPARIGDTDTEVVVLHTAQPTEETEARFYIGKDDFLLRRVAVETTPITKPAAAATVPGKVGDALDELVDGMPPASAPANPTAGTITPMRFKTTYRYDNTIRTPASFDSQTFAFSVPPGALLREPLDFSGKRIQEQVDQQIADILKSKGLTKPKKLRILHY